MTLPSWRLWCSLARILGSRIVQRLGIRPEGPPVAKMPVGAAPRPLGRGQTGGLLRVAVDAVIPGALDELEDLAGVAVDDHEVGNR